MAAVSAAYTVITGQTLSARPGAGLTALATRSTPYTIQGCRPTSVVIQPASVAITAAAPETATARRNQRLAGRSRRRHQDQASQAPRASRPKPMPTMVSKARCTISTGGWSAAGTASSPVTRPDGFRCSSSDSPSGIRSAPCSRPP